MTKTYEQIVSELDAKIPREAVLERDAGQGRTLSYLAGHYVIDRLNRVFGQGNWGYELKELRLVHSGEVNNRQHVHYIAIIHFWAGLHHNDVILGGISARFDEVGYGDGMDSKNIGKAHELAVKEAVTDAIKRAAKNLGMSMGLALYSKEQENVQEPDPKAKAEPTVPPPTNSVAGHEKIIKKIGLTGRILMDKKVLTLDQLKEKLAKHGASKKEDLNSEQAEALDKELSALLGI